MGMNVMFFLFFFSPAAVREQVPIIHPEDPELAHLHGTILTDGNDQYTNEPTANVLIFANQQVSRSTCGTYLTVINDETLWKKIHLYYWLFWVSKYKWMTW